MLFMLTYGRLIIFNNNYEFAVIVSHPRQGMILNLLLLFIIIIIIIIGRYIPLSFLDLRTCNRLLTVS
jgi:hypothetical protein